MDAASTTAVCLRQVNRLFTDLFGWSCGAKQRGDDEARGGAARQGTVPSKLEERTASIGSRAGESTMSNGRPKSYKGRVW